jgi:hypothetical protein
MVSSKMKQAIENLGSIWYTAWVDAGQPILSIKEIKYHIPFGIKNHECD